VTDRTLIVNGQRLPLNAAGQADFVTTAIGSLDVRATASDAASNLGEATMAVEVVNPAIANQPTPTTPGVPLHPGRFDATDTNSPFVEITSPEINASVTNLVPIIGTVDDLENNLWYYRVYAARLDLVSLDSIDTSDPDWKVLNTSTQEVINGELAKFDPSNLTNDPYAIIVAAFDINGRGFIQPTVIMVEGNVQVGNFHLEFTELSLPLAGIPITVTRVYDTLNAGIEGDFGFGWSLGVQDARILETVPADTAFIAGKTKVYLTSPEGRRVGFTFTPTFQGSLFGAIGTPKFTPDPGVNDQLIVDGQFGSGGILGGLSGPFNPNNYTLVTKDGLKYVYDQTAGLQTITDLNNNIVTFTDSGIQHSSGASIDLLRDHRGRIRKIIDPDGNEVSYEYNAVGDLIVVTDQVGRTSRYAYLTTPAHYLDQAFDSLGNRVLDVVFDAQGRYTGVFDALGRPIESRDYDLDRRTVSSTDANGRRTTLVYDDRGNVTSVTDARGKTVTMLYDQNDNVTSVTDADGFKTAMEYDANANLTRVTNALGASAVYEFTPQNRIASITDALGRKGTGVFDARGNLSAFVNADGVTTRLEYDESGRQTAFVDAGGGVTRFEYTGSGSWPTRIQFPDGAERRIEYNSFGDVIRKIDENGHELRFEYDAARRLTRMVNAGGFESILTYEGSNVASVTDSQGRVTSYDYDAVGRLTSVTDPIGGVSRYEYDAVGMLIRETDPLGRPITYTYDEVGNRTSISINPTERFEYDGRGNVVKYIDGNGHSTVTHMTEPVG
jgi:YD repeat-containing protein